MDAFLTEDVPTSRSRRPDFLSKRIEIGNLPSEREDDLQEKIQPSSTRYGWSSSRYEVTPDVSGIRFESFGPGIHESETSMNRPKSVADAKKILEISKKSPSLNYSRFLESNQSRNRSPDNRYDSGHPSILKLKDLDETIQRYKPGSAKKMASEMPQIEEVESANSVVKPWRVQDSISGQSSQKMTTSEYASDDLSKLHQKPQQQKAMESKPSVKKSTLAMQLESTAEKNFLTQRQEEEEKMLAEEGKYLVDKFFEFTVSI